MEQLNEVIYYTIDKAIRTYRQFAQRELKKAGYSITIDQWLIIKTIHENPKIKQTDLAETTFKDNASVTRIIELLVKSNYLERLTNSKDRRRSELKVTKKGIQIVSKVEFFAQQYRAKASKGLSKSEIKTLRTVLTKIINNCAKYTH